MACTFQEGPGSPVGVNTPAFVGQLYHDTTNDEYWRSTGLTNSDWVFVGGVAFVEWLPHTEIATWDDGGGIGQVGDYTAFLAAADLQTLSRLILNGTAVTSVVANNCPSLAQLWASYCSGPITSIDIRGCRALSLFSCAYAAVTSIDFSTNPSLTDVDCSNGQLIELDLSGHTVLSSLQCNGNPAIGADFDVTNCINLTTLSCSYCGLTSLSLLGLPSLRTLFCFNNSLSSIDVSGMTALFNLTVLCQYNTMNAAEVDNVLCDLDAIGSNGGVVDITYNATPTAAGLACVASLTGKAWTVSYDP